MFLSQEFRFEAAHFLTRYHGKCENLHGHSYRFKVVIEGAAGEDGMIVDFVLLKDLVHKNVVRRLDHTSLNDLLENPSAELVCIWIWNVLRDAFAIQFPQVCLYEIQLWETEHSSVIYRGS